MFLKTSDNCIIFCSFGAFSSSLRDLLHVSVFFNMRTAFTSRFTVIEIPDALNSSQINEKECKQENNVPGTGYTFLLDVTIPRIEYQDKDYLPGFFFNKCRGDYKKK